MEGEADVASLCVWQQTGFELYLALRGRCQGILKTKKKCIIYNAEITGKVETSTKTRPRDAHL
jgi:hypothetical protein